MPKKECLILLLNTIRAEELAKKTNDLLQQAKIFSNRGQIYFFRGEEQKALESFTKTLQIAVLSKAIQL